MKKFKVVLTIFTLFISSSTFASSIAPSIIINGILPEKEDVFLIKYGAASSSLELDNSGYLNTSDNTDFIDNTETSNFNIYVGNYTSESQIHTLKFSSVGFKKIGIGSNPNSNDFNFDPGVTPLVNNIYISFINNDPTHLGMSVWANSNYSIKNNIVSNSFAIAPSTSYVEIGSPGYTFKFLWESENDTGTKVPAGDYVAQITVEYIN